MFSSDCRSVGFKRKVGNIDGVYTGTYTKRSRTHDASTSQSCGNLLFVVLCESLLVVLLHMFSNLWLTVFCIADDTSLYAATESAAPNFVHSVQCIGMRQPCIQMADSFLH